MHTVSELRSFRRAASDAGMTEEEIGDLVSFLSENPDAGDEIPGTGGCRKLRIGGRGKGKSGGYRTITFYSGLDLPVYLITVFSKGEKATLTKKECNALKSITQSIVDEYKVRVSLLGERR
jgi:hypothetical protein